MCGIAGFINLNGEIVNKKILKNMTKIISHRGPDGEGIYIDKNIGLGHRRLSIIDISNKGHQPMSDYSNEIVISYNGEIYNFKEIKKELETLGHKFSSRTDTEVIINSWKEWGEGCIYKFNGMFAFALYDKRVNSLFLVRDRYGIKPLYFAKFSNLLLFSSEQKSILEHPKIKKKKIDKKLY